MINVFSGLKPTGSLHLGNYIGAIRQMLSLQADPAYACRYAVADLHSLTVEHSPVALSARTRELAMLLLACGIDPDRSTLFIQSQVAAHAELAYLMEATAHVGELRRMIQFKEKARARDGSRLALLTYPALMAADILAYDTDLVPVGDDQRQHLELARTLATRFNNAYGVTFVVPDGLYPSVAARVMDLQEPARKMGKTGSSEVGTIGLLDPAHVIARKVSRAVTDGGEVAYDRVGQPGVANLLDILAALTHEDPGRLADSYRTYAQLKADVTAAVVDVLSGIQDEYAGYAANPGEVDELLRCGAVEAASLAAPTTSRARVAIGLPAA